MRQQGTWMSWKEALERKLTWNDVWKAKPQRIKFLVQAVYDVLPSPANLYLWGKSDVPACAFCPRPGTLEHILSSCPAALGEGCYCWRHDQIFKSVAEAISSAVENKKYTCGRKKIASVKVGERLQPQPKTSASLLSSAAD